MNKRAWLGVTAVAALILLGACQHTDNDSAPGSGAVVPSLIAPSLTTLRIAAEGSMTGYARADFGNDWDTKPDGCSTRVDILIAQGRDVVHHGCTVTGGQWLSLYDGVRVTNPHALDIDHVVPLAEAWRTGAATWSAAQRDAFANDPTELAAVTEHSNRSKGDDPPPAYEPIAAERCAYARQWITVKVKYKLTISSGELHALAAMVDTCK